MERYVQLHERVTRLIEVGEEIKADMATHRANDVRFDYAALYQPDHPFEQSCRDVFHFGFQHFAPKFSSLAEMKRIGQLASEVFEAKHPDLSDLNVLRSFDPNVVMIAIARSLISKYKLPFNAQSQDFWSAYSIIFYPATMFAMGMDKKFLTDFMALANEMIAAVQHGQFSPTDEMKATEARIRAEYANRPLSKVEPTISVSTTSIPEKADGLVTADFFTYHVGRPPEHDDLDRCNCRQAGEVGHWFCGWDDRSNRPRFMAGVMAPRNE